MSCAEECSHSVDFAPVPRWRDGAESLGMESTRCLCCRAIKAKFIGGTEIAYQCPQSNMHGMLHRHNFLGLSQTQQCTAWANTSLHVLPLWFDSGHSKTLQELFSLSKVAFTLGQNTPRKMVVFIMKFFFIYLSNSQVYGVLRRVIRSV